MTNRTVKLLGYGFGATPAEITVTLEGTTIYSGTVNTADQPVPDLPNLDLMPDQTELCSFELPISFSGQKAMTCEVNSGTVIFSEIYATYALIVNPVFSNADKTVIFSDTATNQQKYDVIAPHAVPSFTTEEESQIVSLGLYNLTVQTILATHGVSIFVSSGPSNFGDIYPQGDERSNISIDGIAKNPVHSGEYIGTFWWTIPDGSTLAYDLNVTAGLE
jgi:hypothetical protein